MANITLRVIGTIGNHRFTGPHDISRYLVKQGFVPSLSQGMERLAFEDQYPIWLNLFGNECRIERITLDHTPDSCMPVRTWMFARENHLAVIAACHHEDEDKIADWYVQHIHKLALYPVEDIKVLLSEMPDPDGTHETSVALKNAIPTLDIQAKAIIAYLKDCLVGVVVDTQSIGTEEDTHDQVHLNVKFSFFGKRFKLAVYNDGEKIWGNVRCLDDADTASVEDLSYLKDTILENFFDYSSPVKNIASYPGGLMVVDRKLDIPGKCIVYECKFSEFTVKVSILTELNRWHAEALAGDESIGFTDEFDVSNDGCGIGQQLSRILYDYRRNGLKAAINSLFNGEVSFFDTNPLLDADTGSIEFRGTYHGVTASFKVNAADFPGKKKEVQVNVFDIANKSVGGILISDTSGDKEWKFLDRQVERASQTVPRADVDYRTDVLAILKCHPSFSSNPTVWHQDTNEAEYDGYYDDCPAKFFYNPATPLSARVVIYSPDDNPLCNVTVRQPHNADTAETWRELNEAVTKCREWKADRLSTMETTLEKLLVEVRTIKLGMNPRQDHREPQGGTEPAPAVGQ